jgi:hypothetical protein
MRHKIIYPFIAICMFIVGVMLVILISTASHTSDSALTVNFLGHKAGFNRLVNMAHEDARFTVIKSTYTSPENRDVWPHSMSEPGFSKGRWDQYRSIFSKLNIEGVSRTSYFPHVIFLEASIRRSPIDEYETEVTTKGYAYSPTELSPLVESLDNVEIKQKQPLIILFKKLEANWYLYYEWGVSKPE